MNEYTVVVLKPDYRTGEYSQNHHIVQVRALNLDSAKEYAQNAACTQDYDHNGIPVNGNPYDYLVVCVFNGVVGTLFKQEATNEAFI
jgi:hypothetical protein